MAEEILLLLSSWPDAESARTAARILVEEKLIACANLIPGVESIYRWQGAVEQAGEVVMLMKTTDARYADIARRVSELHSYVTPELIAFRAAAGLPAYMQWVIESCEANHE